MPLSTSGANHMPVEYHPRQLKNCPTVVSEEGPKKIPLEAHIMSKCPDAQECLQDLVLPAMEQISDKVDFRLSFIAEYVPQNIYHPAIENFLIRTLSQCHTRYL